MPFRSVAGPARARTYAFIGAMVLVGVIFIYTYYLVRSFEKQTVTLTRIFANFCAAATYPATKDEEIRHIFNRVIKDINIPIVVTDPRGVPYTWKNVGEHLNPDDVSWDVFVAANPNNPPPGTMSEVIAIMKDMDENNNPVVMSDPSSGRFLGYVHYGAPAITRRLRWLPLAGAVLLGLFVVVGYLGLRSIIVGERRSIWIGMAKETAHQLGTPLSSLMGWLQILKERCADDRTRETVREMESDVLRLSKISSRFGKVGSPPRLDKEDVVEIARSAVDYQKRRLPSLGREIEIKEHFGNVPKALVNADLLEWAVENLLKNALDAIDKHRGIIEVRATHIPRKGIISIEIEDNGRGVDSKVARRIFEPGYTTRKGGWGLGLPLARRVVEEYHHGTLRLLRSAPGKGSLFVIEIPAMR
jgi:NtrC-family two-component system sensor histidine kinase KinB